jgi:hypothetical protein
VFNQAKPGMSSQGNTETNGATVLASKGNQARVPGLQAGNRPLVEAGGQHFRDFRRGLDYAFTRSCHEHVRVRSVLSGCRYTEAGS